MNQLFKQRCFKTITLHDLLPLRVQRTLNNVSDFEKPFFIFLGASEKLGIKQTNFLKLTKVRCTQPTEKMQKKLQKGRKAQRCLRTHATFTSLLYAGGPCISQRAETWYVTSPTVSASMIKLYTSKSQILFLGAILMLDK